MAYVLRYRARAPVTAKLSLMAARPAHGARPAATYSDPRVKNGKNSSLRPCQKPSSNITWYIFFRQNWSHPHNLGAFLLFRLSQDPHNQSQLTNNNTHTITATTTMTKAKPDKVKGSRWRGQRKWWFYWTGHTDQIECEKEDRRSPRITGCLGSSANITTSGFLSLKKLCSVHGAQLGEPTQRSSNYWQGWWSWRSSQTTRMSS